jgi:hypothetical protein
VVVGLTGALIRVISIGHFDKTALVGLITTSVYGIIGYSVSDTPGPV